MYGKQEATTKQTKVDTGFYYLLAQCTCNHVYTCTCIDLTGLTVAIYTGIYRM
jgi:hypothetical protein